MTNPTAGAVPAPGSDAARKAGCTCPVMQSTYQAGAVRYRIAGKWTNWIATNCPVHDPLPDLTLRPRTDAETKP